LSSHYPWPRAARTSASVTVTSGRPFSDEVAWRPSTLSSVRGRRPRRVSRPPHECLGIDETAVACRAPSGTTSWRLHGSVWAAP